MIESYRVTDRVPAGALAGEARVAPGPVDHLHFDRRARVWRRHPELTRGTGRDALSSAARFEATAL